MCFNSDDNVLQKKDATDLIDFIGEPVSCKTQNIAPLSDIPSAFPSKDIKSAPN